MNTFFSTQEDSSVGVDLKMFNNLVKLLSYIDEIIKKRDLGSFENIVKVAMLSNKKDVSLKLTLVLGYVATKDVKFLIKALVNLMNESSLPISKLIYAASAIMGMDRLIIIGAKYGLLNHKFVNLIIDNLTCRELTTLTGVSGLSDSIGKELLIKILSRALSTTYCKPARQVALEVIAKALSKGKLGVGDLVSMLQRLNMSLLIVRNRKGAIKEIRIISKTVDTFPVDTPKLNDLAHLLLTAST